jgi:hypothetical protein
MPPRAYGSEAITDAQEPRNGGAAGQRQATGARGHASRAGRVAAQARPPPRPVSYPACYGGPADLRFFLTCYRCRSEFVHPDRGRLTACTAQPRRSASAAMAKSPPLGRHLAPGTRTQRDPAPKPTRTIEPPSIGSRASTVKGPASLLQLPREIAAALAIAASRRCITSGVAAPRAIN